jgi:hypothetical protein
MALGPHAVLSHRAAGALWEIVRGAVPTDVLVPPTSGRASRDGIVVHRSALRPEDVGRRNEIPVTSLLRTTMDLAAVQTMREFERSFEEAQVRHSLSPDLLAVEVVCRRRYRGNGRLGAVLKDAVDPAAVLSVLELRFLALCARHGIPRPLVNERFGPWRPDFLWPEARVVVETDGLRFHRTAAQRRRDAEKDAYLRAHGHAVIRLTWADVVERPQPVAAGVLAALAGRDRSTTSVSVQPHRGR